MMGIKYLLASAIIIYGTQSVACVNQTTFGTGAPGYLYNAGSKVFLSWSKTPIERFLWIQGTKEPREAKLFKIQRANYHSATYNLIMAADPDINNLFKQNLEPVQSYPFYGMPTITLLGNQNNQHIGLSIDTSNSNAWFSFSPPITKDNLFKIYLNNKCLEIENMGYLRLQECVLFPTEKKERQLFKWFSEDEYLVFKRHYIKDDRIVKSNPHIVPKPYTPIVDANRKQHSISRTESVYDPEMIKRQESRRIADLPKEYYDNPESSDSSNESYMGEAENYYSRYKNASVQKFKTMPPGF